MSEENNSSECSNDDVVAITKNCAESWLKRIRNFAGFLGMILPWIALIGAVIVAKANPTIIPKDFWSTLSISATYYLTPAMAGILTTASVVLMCYKGYDKKDELVTTISGIFGLMIVLFPCSRQHRRIFPIAHQHFRHHPHGSSCHILFAFSHQQYVPIHSWRKQH